MDNIWSELQVQGIEVDETEMSQDEFEQLFADESVATAEKD